MRARARIEAAMRRIELAAQQPPAGADPEIEQRYRDLWTKTNAVLAELDGLIEGLER